MSIDSWLLVLCCLMDSHPLLVLLFSLSQSHGLWLICGCLPLYSLLQNNGLWPTAFDMTSKKSSFPTHRQLPAEHGYPTGNANILLKQHFYHFSPFSAYHRTYYSFWVLDITRFTVKTNTNVQAQIIFCFSNY